MGLRKFDLRSCRCEAAIGSCKYCRSYFEPILSSEDNSSRSVGSMQLDMFLEGGVYETSSSCSSSQGEKEV